MVLNLSVMNKVIAIISVSLLFILTSFAFPSRFEKKVDKTMKKVWDISSFDTQLISVPDSFNIEVYSIVNKDSLLGYYSVNMVNSCRVGGCSRPTGNKNQAEYENFWVLSVFDTNLLIKHVKVLEYNAEYGFEICNKNWLKQFVGKIGGSISYSNDIDAVSGATISGNSITNHINYLGIILKELRNIKVL